MSQQHRIFRVFKESDRAVVDALIAVSTDVGAELIQLMVYVAQDGGASKQILPEAVEDHTAYLSSSETNLGRFNAVLCRSEHRNDGHRHITILLIRRDGHDEFRIAGGQNAPFDQVVAVISSTQKHFKPFERTEAIDQLLGAELSEFYRRREEALMRLETTQQRLIEQQHAYQQDLQKETEEIRMKIYEDGEAHKVSLDAKHTERTEALDLREEGLDQRLKVIDDRDSKHARRQHQKEIKDAINKLDTHFSLSRGTSAKRTGIHIVFVAGLLFTLAGVMYSLWADAEIDKIAT